MRRFVQVCGVLAIAGGLWLVPGTSLFAADKASAGATDPGALFDKLDTDHSGILTADKIPADKRSLFERLLRLAGKPADGQLNRAEFVAQLKSITEPPANGVVSSSSAGSGGSTSSKSPAGAGTAKPAGAPAAADVKKQPDPAKVFDRFDKNHTGKLTINDVPEARQQLFKRLLKIAGKPEGSSLTKDEFVKAFEEVLANRAGAPAAKPTAGAGKNAASANAGEGFDVDTAVGRLMKLSSRPDGKLTKTDLPERMQARFDKIDTNQDGLVDETELRSWLTKVKGQLAAVRALSGASNTPAESKDAPKSDAASGNGAKSGSGASNN
jgi:Ca2+-binding EF-hand superfamily protein